MFVNISNLISTVLCIYSFSATPGDSKVLRVFQGRDAVSGEFPYAVALAIKFSAEAQYEFYESFCSGCIITPVWTLTAGHCVESIENIAVDPFTEERPKMVIRYSISTDNKQYKWVNSDIIGTRLFPGYGSLPRKNNEFTVTNDIGLVKTNNATDSVLGRFSPVDYRTLYGHKVSSVGFGLMNTKGGIYDALKLNKSLQVYDAVVVKCYLTMDTIRPSFCMSWECNKPATSCSGDSGGPIIHPTGIIALVSAGENSNCNTVKRMESAGIATPISPFLNWIVKHVQET